MSSQLPERADRWLVHNADTLQLLPTLPNCSVDAVVSDPPYGIDFQGEAWDGASIRTAAGDHTLSPGQAFERWAAVWAAECLRILKPGGHLVAFGAPRVAHRLASGVEDAGFELRDTLMWLYGQGMPKSRRLPGGQGTSLKPAYEPIILARRSLDGTTAANLDQWGTGTLNIDPCRVPNLDPDRPCTSRRRPGRPEPDGRWPANVALSHAPKCTSQRCDTNCPIRQLDIDPGPGGPPSRFFYCAKASRRERDAGCEHFAARTIDLFPSTTGRPSEVRNAHPTVKPLSLMRWLVRLVTPPDGLVLDPFTGSGSTGCAAVLEDRRFVGVELDPVHAQVARARIAHWQQHPDTDEPVRLSSRALAPPPRRRGAH